MQCILCTSLHHVNTLLCSEILVVATVVTSMCMYCTYCTVWREAFEGENVWELVGNTIFVEKTFADCSLVLPKDTMPPNFAEKTFANTPSSHKTLKFAKVFSLESFPLYSTTLKSKLTQSGSTLIAETVESMLHNYIYSGSEDSRLTLHNNIVNLFRSYTRV